MWGFGRFDIKEHVTGFGNPDWKRTHEPANRTAAAVTTLLKHGATCVGKTVMDELSFGCVFLFVFFLLFSYMFGLIQIVYAWMI